MAGLAKSSLEISKSVGNQDTGVDRQKEKLALDVYDLGFSRDYNAVWSLQKELLRQRIASEIPDSLILVEHDHVITLGRSSHAENVLIRDLPVFEIERGGDVTYHGPGQLVGYPIISLEERNLGVRQFIELLESVLIDALQKLGVSKCEGLLGKETGVWISNKKRKIVSIGVAVSHWVTYHGFALNVNTDLSFFQRIRPCGYESSIMTSVKNELKFPQDIEIASVKRIVLNSFENKLEGATGRKIEVRHRRAKL